MPSIIDETVPSLCDYDDHESWGKTRRLTYLLVELALILCGVLLSQSVRSYGHGFSYIVVFALCSIVLQMMPYGLGDWTRGNALTFPDSGLTRDANPFLKSNPFGSMLMTLTIQWLACMVAATVVQACGTFRWFHRLLVKYFNTKSKRAMVPTLSALLGVFSALGCGTDAINLMYIAPLISASKVIGLRPSKPLSALVVGGMLGAACSPVSSASQFYYNRYTSFALEKDQIVYDGPWELMPYMRIVGCVVPGAVVGAIIAGIVATFIGRDLAKSKTYQLRQEAGLVSLPGEEDYNCPGQYRSEDASMNQHRSSRKSQSGTVEERTVNTKILTKLEREFSMQSRLEDGDYVYTNARFRDGTFVDINDRTGTTAARANSGTRKSVTINVKKESGVSAAETRNTTGAAAGDDDPSHSTHPVHSSGGDYQTAPVNATIAMGVMVGVGVVTLIYGMLRGAPSKTISSDDGQSKIDGDGIIPADWPLPAELIHPVLIMTAAGVLMLALRIKGWQLNHAPIIRSALPGIVGLVCFSALGSTYLWEWKNHFNCTMISWSGSKDNAFTWPFWMFLMSMFSGSDMLTQHRMSNYISFLPSVTTRVRWLAAGFPAAAGAVFFPTNANMLIAAQLDDTGSTRLGDYLLDHVFIVPGIVGVACAAILAYCIAIGVFPM